MAELLTEITEGYERFAESQKPLDPEFARLLSANLWELYAREVSIDLQRTT